MFAVIKAIATIINTVASVISMVTGALRDRAKQKKEDQYDDALANDAAAKVIVDDAERLRKKAHAACQIEKAGNPDANCNDGSGK